MTLSGTGTFVFLVCWLTVRRLTCWSSVSSWYHLDSLTRQSGSLTTRLSFSSSYSSPRSAGTPVTRWSLFHHLSFSLCFNHTRWSRPSLSWSLSFLSQSCLLTLQTLWLCQRFCSHPGERYSHFEGLWPDDVKFSGFPQWFSSAFAKYC